MTAPTLIFAWGNPSRGDDAVGPRLIDRLESLIPRHPEWPDLELLTDFQLQVEHALDLIDRRQVLFVDASVAPGHDDPAPFAVAALTPARDSSFTTHAMTPQAILQVFRDTQDSPLPACQLLAIHGHSFELGDDLSPQAEANLDAALRWLGDWLTALGSEPSPCHC